MGDFIPNPANYTMKANPPKPVPIAAPEIGFIDVERLDGLPHHALLALCRRMALQCGLVAVMTQEETAQAMLDKLAHIALKPIVPGLQMAAQARDCMAAINAWLDREQGKPTQRVETKTLVATFDVNQHLADVRKQTEEMFSRLAKVTTCSIEADNTGKKIDKPL